MIRASTSNEQIKSEGLVIRNCCPVPLKVLVEDDAAAFAGLRVGQSVSQLQHHRCIVISAPSTKSGGVVDYRSGCLTSSMLAGSTSAMLLVLNESDLIVGKKSVPCNGTRDLYMDLDNGAFALDASTVKEELLSLYQVNASHLYVRRYPASKSLQVLTTYCMDVYVNCRAPRSELVTCRLRRSP